MIAYCASTSTKTTLSALQAARWRLLMTPDILKRTKDNQPQRWPNGATAPYALDNGAYGAFNRGRPFNGEAFKWAVERVGRGADWVAIPDAVGNATDTFKLAAHWFKFVTGHTQKPLFVVQDGMAAADVAQWCVRGCGLFIGGTTEYKLKTMAQWARLAHRHGQICHVGRVNTQKRIILCGHAGVDSFDGSGVAQFPNKLTLLDRALVFTDKQGRLL